MSNPFALLAMICWCLVAVFAETLSAQEPSSAIVTDYPLKPIPFNEVELTSAFWRPRLVTQRETLVPFAFELSDEVS